MKAPDTLTPEAADWWHKLTADYGIDDQAGLLLLQTAMESFDRMRQCQAAITKDGPTVADRFGQLKAHPLATVERDSRNQMMAALKALNLDLEPLKDAPGRPPETHAWTGGR